MQISEQIVLFGQGINLRVALVIGGAAMNKQIELLERYPHVVIGTPGRVCDMLEKCGKFREDVENVEMLVLD
jgi:superfamily II DNA/RNA helicase